MILYEDRYFEDFEEVVEYIIGDKDYKGENIEIKYFFCKLEPLVDFSIENIVEILTEERDDEDGDASEKLLHILRKYADEEKIREEMPKLWYPYGTVNTVMLHDLEEFKEYGN